MNNQNKILPITFVVEYSNRMAKEEQEKTKEILMEFIEGLKNDQTVENDMEIRTSILAFSEQIDWIVPNFVNVNAIDSITMEPLQGTPSLDNLFESIFNNFDTLKLFRQSHRLYAPCIVYIITSTDYMKREDVEVNKKRFWKKELFRNALKCVVLIDENCNKDVCIVEPESVFPAAAIGRLLSYLKRPREIIIDEPDSYYECDEPAAYQPTYAIDFSYSDHVLLYRGATEVARCQIERCCKDSALETVFTIRNDEDKLQLINLCVPNVEIEIQVQHHRTISFKPNEELVCQGEFVVKKVEHDLLIWPDNKMFSDWDAKQPMIKKQLGIGESIEVMVGDCVKVNDMRLFTIAQYFPQNCEPNNVIFDDEWN